jgi:hypothetical protein
MRVEKSVTAVTWIPSEAIEGMPKLPFELGMTSYDDPPPDRLGSGQLELARRGRLSRGERATSWIEVDEGKIVDSGYSGGAHIGRRTKIGRRRSPFPVSTIRCSRPSPRSGLTGSSSCRAPAAGWGSRRRGG